MLRFLARLILRKELEALERYRRACYLVIRWNARIPASRETGKWIHLVGEEGRAEDIERLREQLRAWRA